MKVFKAAGAVLLICLIAVSQIGCQNNRQEEDNDALLNYTLQVPLAFGSDCSNFAEEDDLQGALQELFLRCYNEPEVLASTVTAFPSLLQACDLNPDATPQEIDDILSLDANGGVVQEKLLIALSKLLENPTTSSEFFVQDGQIKMLYMYLINEQAVPTPAIVSLKWMRHECQSAACLKITGKGLYDSSETGYFYLPGGFQRFELVETS